MLTGVLSIWRRICALGVLTQDLLLLTASALFALVSAFVASPTDYAEWGKLAFAFYAAASLATAGVVLRGRRLACTEEMVARLRRWTAVGLLFGVVLVPLCSELIWRAEATPHAQAQPEVAVIERAADRAASGHDPYLAHPESVGIPPTSDAKDVDADSYYPYLPGMVLFGLVNETSAPQAVGDARVVFVAFSLLIFAAALRLSGASARKKYRALQFFVLLPTGALPLVTGGDDLPVLALLFLALVLADRRRPVGSGLVAAFACTLKFTAWPIAALLFLAVRDRSGNSARARYGVALSASIPVVALGWLAGPRAFVENVIRFPLGLTAIKSPAASPLLGQILVNVFPPYRREITLLLSVLGLGIVAALLWRRVPRSPAAVAQFAAVALCVATALAPATRFGYLIYPVNLFAWAYVLDGSIRAPGVPIRADQFPSGTSSRRRSTDDDTDDEPAPLSAGVIDGLAARTVIPTSQ